MICMAVSERIIVYKVENSSHFIYLIAWLNSISGSLSEEICQKEVKPVTIETRIHKNSIPKGGVSAGRYTKDKDSTNQWLCIVSCCQDPNNCDSAFFHKNVCYLIKCNVTYSGACDPVTKTDAKYNDTVYVNVRDVGRLYMKQVWLLWNETAELTYFSKSMINLHSLGFKITFVLILLIYPHY